VSGEILDVVVLMLEFYPPATMKMTRPLTLLAAKVVEISLFYSQDFSLVDGTMTVFPRGLELVMAYFYDATATT
jgi:hypothetical protein